MQMQPQQRLSMPVSLACAVRVRTRWNPVRRRPREAGAAGANRRLRACADATGRRFARARRQHWRQRWQEQPLYPQDALERKERKLKVAHIFFESTTELERMRY
jgi:hypothetical protein